MNLKYTYIVIVLLSIAAIYMILTNSINRYGNKDKNRTLDLNKEKEVRYMNITPEEMKKQISRLDKSMYVILDVRTKAEYEEERIPNSVLLTLDEIEEKTVVEIVPDKDISIYVYCRSGRRSHQATYELMNLGYTNVYDLGGILDYPYETIKGKE